MNVLMVAMKFPPFFAGAAVQAVFLSKALIKKGLHVEFVTDNAHLKSVHDTYQGIPVFRFSTFLSRPSKLKDLVYICQVLLFVLKNRRFQIIHFHSMRSLEFVLFPILKLLGKKIVLKLTLVDSDDPMSFKRRKFGFLYLWGFSFVDRFVAISTRLEELALEAGIPAHKVKVLFNGVEVERFFPLSDDEKRKEKKRLGCSDAAVFVSAGKVEYRKGYDLLLEAWRNIQREMPDALLLIIGPGNDSSNPYYLDLARCIQEQNLNVRFLGYQENMDAWMKIADMFVFCSRSEGFGTVLIEAMSAAVPTVAMNIPGVTEDILKDPVIGRICRSRSSGDFTGLCLVMMKERVPALVERAAERVRQEFGIDAVAGRYVELYRKMFL